MQRWRNLSIARKVLAAFGVVFLSVIGLGLFGLSQTAEVNRKAAEIRNNWLPSTARLGRMAVVLRDYRAVDVRLVLAAATGDAAELATQMQRLPGARAAVDKAFAAYQPLITPGTEDERLMKAFVVDWTAMQAASARLAEQAGRSDGAAARALFNGDGLKSFEAAIGAVMNDLAFNEGEGAAAGAAAAAEYQRARELTIAALVLCGLLCAGAGWAMISGVSAPLRAAAAGVGRLADGRLDEAVGGTARGDEIGALGRALEVLRQNGLRARETEAAQLAEQASKAARGRQIETLVHDFEQRVGEMVQKLAGVSAASQASGAAAGQVLAAAGDLSVQAERLSAEMGSFVGSVRAA